MKLKAVLSSALLLTAVFGLALPVFCAGNDGQRGQKPKIKNQALAKPVVKTTAETAPKPPAAEPAVSTPAPAAPPVADASPTVPETAEKKEKETQDSLYLIRPGDKLKIFVYREPDLTGVFPVNSLGTINYSMLGEMHVDGMSIEEFKDLLVRRLSEDYLVDPQVQVEFEESPNKSVSILGQVVKPGNYILSPNLTIVRLISQIGGFSLTAAPERVRLVRHEREGKITMDVNVTRIMRGEADDVLLKPGDMIYVEKEDSLTNTVSILGQVNRPGNYALTTDLTLVRLISEAGGFTPVAAPSNVKVVRKKEDGKDASFTVNAQKIIDGKQADIILEPKDLVVVGESFF